MLLKNKYERQEILKETIFRSKRSREVNIERISISTMSIGSEETVIH